VNPKLNPLDELLRAADLANRVDPKNAPQLSALLQHSDSAVRWWAAIGLASLIPKSPGIAPPLRAALNDSSPDVRLVAAEALALHGEPAVALPVLERALHDKSVFIRLAALKAASRLGTHAAALVPAIRKAALRDPAHKDVSDYVERMVEYLPEQLSQ
jgi:N-sulfoglucosamine sulfohydrolase